MPNRLNHLHRQHVGYVAKKGNFSKADFGNSRGEITRKTLHNPTFDPTLHALKGNRMNTVYPIIG
jgi:hypothetical protein